ncbi:hypothetical protein IGB42_03682 [Andreprevotia sp. IGB-42]|uniref:hypothetical protein n=1 Tax=Andreprevotia sp. IGB-42 TaxID=2497473 RepID=UPI00135AAFA3|nr:hypothetical protein [Andreprevotia sp. IGB-42]KAF0811872.1 hypothetical protein IGB42_03682 [Andreprevotia sp. IGB-42]
MKKFIIALAALCFSGAVLASEAPEEFNGKTQQEYKAKEDKMKHHRAEKKAKKKASAAAEAPI